MKTIRGKVLVATLAVAAAALAMLAPAASAEVLVPSQGEDISITGGEANPYPSELFVQEADGNVTDLNVTINLSHTWPDDVDIVLEGPTGETAVLMSDACGSGDLAGASITFTDEAIAGLANEGPCGSGSFKPTNIEGGDVWGGEGPGEETSTLLSNFDGETPNGFWNLWVIDDFEPEDNGLIASWSLTITTATAEVIVPGIGSSGKAKPYPSTKTFNTPPGRVISDVNFETPDISHTWPDDIDMLLAGPRAGATTMLMSDACGSTDITNFLWVFDDEASAPMSDNTITGCFPFFIKPSDFETPENMPSPAPARPYGSTLSVFDGLEGGAFSLFAADDVGSDTGYLSSWTLKLQTRDAADTGFAAASTRIEEGGTALLTVNRGGPASLGPATVNVSTDGGATPGADFTAPPSTLSFARGQSSATISVPIANDKVGEPLESFRVLLSAPRDDARLTGTTAAEVTIGPDNEFKFGKLRRNEEKGTGSLLVKLPGPGKVVLTGKKAKRAKKTAKKAGNLALPVKPRGGALAALEDEGVAKFSVKVTFTPTGGSPLTLLKRVKLVLED
jgi:subtilisin-like proprotein convertase family protein